MYLPIENSWAVSTHNNFTFTMREPSIWTGVTGTEFEKSNYLSCLPTVQHVLKHATCFLSKETSNNNFEENIPVLLCPAFVQSYIHKSPSVRLYNVLCAGVHANKLCRCFTAPGQPNLTVLEMTNGIMILMV